MDPEKAGLAYLVFRINELQSDINQFTSSAVKNSLYECDVEMNIAIADSCTSIIDDMTMLRRVMNVDAFNANDRRR